MRTCGRTGTRGGGRRRGGADRGELRRRPEVRAADPRSSWRSCWRCSRPWSSSSSASATSTAHGWHSATTRASGGVLQAAGLLFFAFAGTPGSRRSARRYAIRRAPFPRAIPMALGHHAGGVRGGGGRRTGELGSAALASATRPAGRRGARGGSRVFEPVVRVGAAVAALGSLLV